MLFPMSQELDFFYAFAFISNFRYVVELCVGRPPVSSEFVCPERLSLEVFGSERCQRTFRKWNIVVEDLGFAGIIPNSILS
jgi:hypothetical protein